VELNTRLGNTGLKISRLALGCMSYGDPATEGAHRWALADDQAQPFFRQAIELGITFWDTANVYQAGTSEEVVGRAIRRYSRREDIVLATKVFGKMHDGPGGSGLSRKAIMEQIEVRLDPDSTGFSVGRPSGRGELRGWLALPGDEAFDPASLLFAVDAFPPATFDIEFSGWVPTLELTAYVRAVPAPGPVRVLHRAQLIDAGRVDESCFVWDKTGRLVAQGTQLAGIRLG